MAALEVLRACPVEVLLNGIIQEVLVRPPLGRTQGAESHVGLGIDLYRQSHRLLSGGRFGGGRFGSGRTCR